MPRNELEITVSLPAEIGELSEEEDARLKEAVRTELANVLSNKPGVSLAQNLITNTTSPAAESVAARSSSSGRSSKKAGKKVSKKAGKKR